MALTSPSLPGEGAPIAIGRGGEVKGWRVVPTSGGEYMSQGLASLIP
jgi:hypothetical protein